LGLPKFYDGRQNHWVVEDEITQVSVTAGTQDITSGFLRPIVGGRYRECSAYQYLAAKT
jgi:hypothetical protein